MTIILWPIIRSTKRVLRIFQYVTNECACSKGQKCMSFVFWKNLYIEKSAFFLRVVDFSLKLERTLNFFCLWKSLIFTTNFLQRLYSPEISVKIMARLSAQQYFYYWWAFLFCIFFLLHSYNRIWATTTNKKNMQLRMLGNFCVENYAYH